MASQITPTNPHNYEVDHNRGGVHSVGEHDEDHQEKKSMLTKVKDRAKRIKNTLTNKLHPSDEEHIQDHGPANEVRSTVIREEDDDEDSKEEPEVHGAPMYDSETAHDLTGQEEIRDQSRVNLGSARPVQGEEEHVSKDSSTLQTHREKIPDQSKVNLGSARPFQGGNEDGVPNLDHSFQAMNLSDKSNPPTGSHDQLSPESPSSEKARTIPENPHPVSGPNNESQPSKDQPPDSSYTGKIYAATSAFAQGAFSAKNAVASKLGYGQSSNIDNSGSATSAPSSGPTEAVSKIQGGGNRSESPESEVTVTETDSGVKRSDSGVPVSEFEAEKLPPGDEHKPPSEMIRGAIEKKRETPESGSEQPPTADRVSVSGEGDGAGKGVVERFKGAFGSVLGMGGGSHDSPAPASQSRDGDENLARDGGVDKKSQVSVT